MRRIATLTLVLLTASCGANYSPNGDLAPDPSQPQAAINTNQVCRSCVHDVDCGPNAFCATEDATGDQFCTTPCYSDGTCDSGFTCFTIDDNGNTGCYPSSGTCEGIIATSGGTGSGGSDTGSTSAGATSAGATSAGATSAGATSAGATSSGTTSAGATSSGTTTGSTTTAGATSSGTTTGSTTTAGATSSGTTTAGATTTGSGSTTSSSSTTGTTGACTSDSWTGTMKSFFSSKCSSCHNVSKSFADSGQSRIDSGSMPPGGGLSQSDRQRVDTWIGCGSP